MHLRLIHVVVQQKPTEHCKAIILWLKINVKKCKKKKIPKTEQNRQVSGNFPGGPVVKNLLSSGEDAGSTPGQGTKIPHAMWQAHLPKLLSLRVAMKIPGAPRPETGKKKIGFLLYIPLYLQGCASSLIFGHIP